MNHYLAGLMVVWQSEKARAARSPLLTLLQLVCAIALLGSMFR